MIARFGYFEGLTEEQKRAQEDNARGRFKAALTRQPGILAVYYVESPNGDRATISIWENKQAMDQGGIKANAAPLLPGQRGEDIPSPSRVEIWEVLDQFVAPAAARA
jgi:heme-degrading monooxygenase HmoA